MKVNCVWEHNGDDSILYASNFVGAFSRGASKEEAISKMPEEIRRFQLWRDEKALDDCDVVIVQEKKSDLQLPEAEGGKEELDEDSQKMQTI